MSPARARLVIVDDFPADRLLLRVLLEATGEFLVVGEADDATSAVDVVAAERPDVVLLDPSLRSSSPADLVPRLEAASPSTRVVAWSSFDARAPFGSLVAVVHNAAAAL